MSSKRITPRPPKGFRDFLPQVMLKRNYVMDTVTDVFHLYGFEPLQTPVIELKDTLYGKYGEEAENLIYNVTHGQSSTDELSMRYDLTVPLARVVAQYENELTFPFRRYQISPVFRGERPQKGRYREFYQCDVDIVGVADMSADAEVIGVVVTTLNWLGFNNFTVKVNHRKLLTAIGQYSGVPDDQLPDLYRSVDKFDKIGADGVRNELIERGIAADVVDRMMKLITEQRPGTDNLNYLKDVLGDIPDAAHSIDELRAIAAYLEDMGIDADTYAFDLTMVRGLGYYTGPIFETVITEPNLGSIAGGGRYDELIGMFRKESLPTTGVSLGIERIIDLMDTFDLYPPELNATVVQVMVTVFDETTQGEATRLTRDLRADGVNTELYMGNKKLGKQFNYADRKGIPLVAIMGPDEVAAGQVKLKWMADGEEILVNRDTVSEQIRQMTT